MNTALQLSGDFSDKATKDLQAYASELQNATRFGDELVLNQLALAKSFGATNEQAKQITSAAADLAASFGIDLESATRNVAKTLGGYAGELGEVIPELKNLTQEQLRAGAGIDVLAAKFAGAASKDVLTFSGQIDQLSNVVGDLFEQIGFLITQNPKFTQLLKSTTALFAEAGNSLSGFSDDFDLFNTVTSSLVSFNRAFINYVVSPLELALNIGDLLQKGLNNSFALIQEGVAKLGFGISTVLDKLGIGEKLSGELRTFSEAASETSAITGQAVKDAIDNVFNFSVSDKLMQENENLDMFFQNVSQKAEMAAVTMQEKQTAIAATTQENLINMVGVFESVGSAFQTQAVKVEDSIKQINENVKKFSAEAGKQLRTGLAQGAGRAFAEFGRALVSGENALEAFTRSFLKAIGEQAVALGTRFILEGTAYAFVPGYQGLAGPLIAAGAALAAFGGALGAVAGGGESGGGGGGAVSGTDQAIANTNEELASPDLVQEAEDRVNLNLSVEGSLVRESELNGYITNLLEEGSSRDANIIPSLVTS